MRRALVAVAVVLATVLLNPRREPPPRLRLEEGRSARGDSCDFRGLPYRRSPNNLFDPPRDTRPLCQGYRTIGSDYQSGIVPAVRYYQAGSVPAPR
jgi:hypothetical protein